MAGEERRGRERGRREGEVGRGVSKGRGFSTDLAQFDGAVFCCTAAQPLHSPTSLSWKILG